MPCRSKLFNGGWTSSFHYFRVISEPDFFHSQLSNNDIHRCIHSYVHSYRFLRYFNSDFSVKGCEGCQMWGFDPPSHLRNQVGPHAAQRCATLQCHWGKMMSQSCGWSGKARFADKTMHSWFLTHLTPSLIQHPAKMKVVSASNVSPCFAQGPQFAHPISLVSRTSLYIYIFC